MEKNMSKELRDGLFLDNSIFIIDERKPGFPLQARIIQFLAILIGSWSSISVLLESTPVPARALFIYITILLCAGTVYALCLLPSLDLVKLFFGFLFYALFFFSRLPQLKNGFYIMENVVLGRLADYYNYSTARYVADYTTAGRDSTLLMIMITIPIVSLLVVAIVRSRFVSITAIILFLPVAVSFLFGLIPSEKYLIAYLAAVLYLTRSGFFARHHILNKEQKNLLHRINSRAAVWLSLIGILLFFFLKLFISEEKYDNISQINDLKDEIQTTLFNFTLEDLTHSITRFELPSISLPAGGLDGGKLGKAGKIEYTESEQLRVTAPLQDISDGFYLKGYVGSVYTGDSWDGHSEETDRLYKELLKKMPEEEFAPVNQISRLIGISGQTGLIFEQGLDDMTIEYYAANKKYLYAPYFTDYSLNDNVKYKQDLYAAPGKKTDSYTFEFYNPGKFINSGLLNIINPGGIYFGQMGLPDMEDYSKYEKLYQEFVHQAYTGLPEKGLDRLKQNCAEILSQNPDYNIYDKLLYVMDYLDDNTRYTLSPGTLPRGEDFVEYFLYENKKGYCAHYASAATLMLRAMGVPARYVEGYAVSSYDIIRNTISVSIKDTLTDRNIELSVKDYNAHAWVEIYVDGYGWIPMDFTPASAIDFSALNEAIAPVTEAASPTPTPVAPTPKLNKPQTDTVKPEAVTPKAPAVSGQDISEEQHKFDSLFLVLFVLFAAVFIAAAAAVVFYKKRKMKKVQNRNRRAIYLFAQIEKILAAIRGLGKKGARLEDSEEYVKENCSFIDTDTFASFMETVRKARYGKGRISSEELQQAERFRQNLYIRVYRELPFLKKLYLRLVLFV
jgi:hypothetical protein